MLKLLAGFFTINILISGKFLGTDYEIRGPLDEDKDGDPELLVVYGGVTVSNLEIPASVFMSTLVLFVQQAIGAAMAMLFKGGKK